MSRLARLKFKTDLAVMQYSPLVQQLMFGPRLSGVLVEYLIMLHCIIRSTEGLFNAAIDEANRRWLDGEEGCRGLAEYLTLHKEEEVEHAEWLLDDIEVMGVSREQVLSRRPQAEVAALAGSQYYWIYHYHPAMFLGYLLALEGYPMQAADIAHFKQLTGFPDDAFRTLALHADLDTGHSDELLQFLENCSLTDTVFDSISTSSMTSCAYLSQALKSLESH